MATLKPPSDWGLGLNSHTIIAGPCSTESREQVLKTAEALAPLPISIFRAGVWKPRTRPDSFQGAGEKAFPWLQDAALILGKPIAVEVLNPHHVELCLNNGIDVLWIGARTTTNPFAVEELAQALKGVDIPVLIKNPIIPDIYLWTGAIERLMKVGLTKLAAIHRGFFQESPSEYRYPPLWRIPLHLKKLYPGIPLWCDPSHISGNKLLIPDLCQKAIDLLFTGLMIECHISPNEALSDSEQQLSPAELSVLLGQLEWKKESLALHSLELNELRDKIDLYDEEIINILSLRMQTAQQIGAVKRKAGISLLQPGRWSQLLESRLAQGQIKGLSNQFIEELWDIIHEESLRRQGQELAPEIKTIDFLEDGPTLQH